MNKNIKMVVMAVIGVAMVMNAQARGCVRWGHCGYGHRGGYYGTAVAAGVVGGLVGGAIMNASRVDYGYRGQTIVVQEPYLQTVYQQPVVVQQPQVVQQPVQYVQQVAPPPVQTVQYVQQPQQTYTYNTTTTYVQQPPRNTGTQLLGVGVNVLGLKVGVGAGW